MAGHAVAEVDVKANLAQVRAGIARAAAACGRDPAGVTLVAVSKAQGPGPIAAAIMAGQRVFAENRVQEARGKWPALRAAHPGIELRLIGHLQTNKAAEAVALFDAIETVDSPRLARALAKEAAQQGRRPRCLVQVNTGAEAQKSGAAPNDAEVLVAECRALGLAAEGLMCIPPIGQDPMPHFRALAALARRLGLGVLSMGMSADYQAAIAAGATHVRLGTAIFGARR
ncbi:MAG: YggS family pyridoxal phosphate-dependent enzyme [Rhodospirillales bacterium]